MKIFVTGASGFLGTALCKRLREQGHELTTPSSSECNLFMPTSLDIFANEKYDAIFHLAAWTQAGDFCLKHPGEQWIKNQLLNTHVLKWWQEFQPQAKLVLMGTSCAYAPDSHLVESEYMDGEPIDSLYTYAMTKRMLYQGARALSKQYGLKYLCVVPSTLYGPGYHTDGRQMHFIFDLIRKIIRGKELGESVELWGNGHQKREVIHIDDFINALLVLNLTQENELINLGAGKEYSIRQFAHWISQEVGFDENHIMYDESKYIGAKSKCLNVDKVKSILDSDYRLTDMSVGIKQVVGWFYDTKAYI
jgi:GDP-L-fucose synthase